MSRRSRPPDYDSPWKEALERFFPQFLEFFFPDAHARIDWSRGFLFLDKELQKIVRDAELGRRFADKLVRVTTAGGEEEVVHAHVEVQGSRKEDFDRRMFVYHYRIYDRYAGPTASFAVLADEDPTWRPGRFETGSMGTDVRFRYQVAKILDYPLEALEESPSPFALIALAHRRTQAAGPLPEARLAAKVELVRQLYARRYNREDVLELFRFIDWILELPREIEARFSDELDRIERRANMRYVTSIERRGIEEGIQKGIQKGIRRGIEQGIEKGIEKGIEQGRREMLARMIEKRFGKRVARRAARKLERIQEIEELDGLAERLLDATDAASFLARLEA